MLQCIAMRNNQQTLLTAHCSTTTSFALREAQRQRPLLGEREPLDSLLPEYQDSGTVFAPKIRSLMQQYCGFRRTRQDGNCFYRSFLFGLIEHLLTSKSYAAAKRLVAIVAEWKVKLAAAGFQALVFEDAQDILLEYLKQVYDVKVQAPT